MKKRYILVLFAAIAIEGFSQQQTIKEFTHPSIMSFEAFPSSLRSDKNSRFQLSKEHYKHLNHSLKWEWTAPGAQWSINDSIAYRPNKSGFDTYLSSFVFWVYSATPLQGKKLRVEFLKEKKVHCYFEYGLDFQGWRGAWLAFGRDMQGTPVDGMDQVRFTAPDTSQGTLYFDHILLSSFQDTRHHTADFQAPYINAKTKNHWLILHNSWIKDFDIPLPEKLLPSQLSSIEKISDKLTDMLLQGKKVKPEADLKKRVEQYNITSNGDGTIKGLPIFFERYGETYELLGAQRYNILFNNPMGLAKVNTLLYDLAVGYQKTTIPADKERYADMFIQLTRHLMDQGFEAGSAMGTLHHSGYSMRDYYRAMYLMEEPLRLNGLKHRTQQAMEWFAGTGEVKVAPAQKGIDIDAFNTYVIARLASILMMENGKEKMRYMAAFSRWLNNGYEYVEGTTGSFKIDGTIFHHRHHYPAYAVGGLSGAVQAVYLLQGTDFKIAEKGHANLKKALETMRIYSNLLTWPLSLSGRHPDGKGSVVPEHFGLLALAGTPDGSQPIDPEMAGAYLRLVQKPTGRANKLIDSGFSAEKSPNGNWTYNYSSLNIHRRKDWMIAAMGHSRYLWATETYRGENMYGRYLNHGSLQILANGTPISNEGSGYRQEGWDWNHFPGTTATNLPIKDLRAKIRNLDIFSGFEEMLLSDEAFAGGISIGNKNGAYAMKLHEHDKYNGSLRARKSVFFFDNRVIALGTNIRSALPQEVHTTLFQVHLDNTAKPYYINGKNVTAFPYQASLTGKNILSDGLNNYFFVKQGNVDFTKMRQHSFHEETDEPTENDFAKAVINHGPHPQSETYEYMILVQPTSSELRHQLKSKTDNYKVLRQDSTAHIVHDYATRTTGYVLFEPTTLNNVDLPLLEVNLPCLIMTEISDKSRMNISVCDPDLRFYEGPADEKYDKDGKRIERSVYGRKWIENVSGKSIVRLKLKGEWQITVPNEHVSLIRSSADETILQINCQHGMPREFQVKM